RCTDELLCTRARSQQRRLFTDALEICPAYDERRSVALCHEVMADEVEQLAEIVVRPREVSQDWCPMFQEPGARSLENRRSALDNAALVKVDERNRCQVERKARPCTQVR